MQSMRSTLWIPALSTRLTTLSSPLSSVKKLPIRMMFSQSTSAPAADRRILLKPLAHGSLDKSAGSFFVPNRQDPSFHCDDFTMVLKSFPRNLTDDEGRLDETRLIPHWLPSPVDPATHQRRHLRPPLYLPSTSASPSDKKRGDGDRWEPLSPHPLTLASEPRPIMRIFVVSTKKRIHKLAVIRHRTRTRLVSALRTAIHRRQAAGEDVSRILDLRKRVIMLIASPGAYGRTMPELVEEMDKGLRRVTGTHSHSSHKNPSHKGFGMKRNK